ncbi:hypothetical protein [Sulfurimonas microaerophilic]|uniref:hypothetical protein n=1 Tax=Sulfurimonas microaerophilic TaxID=3058392 RepID=UPI00271513AB|nr:hypothetical protein [Sulfurimonas sp. hsl 1-7]
MTKYTLIFTALITILLSGCSNHNAKPTNAKAIQDVQVFVADNSDEKITPTTIEEGFISVGMDVPGNNNMNKPFSQRFGNTHYKVYNLAMYQDPKSSLKLVKKYPKFGALIPLTMSIWSDGKTMNISTLTLDGMARATGISVDDPDLVAYSKKIHAALKAAMPNGSFKKLNYNVAPRDQTLATDFVFDIDLDGANPIDWKEDTESEYEAEMEPLGFLFPNFTNLQEELFDDADYHKYDFYDTYSICKFDVIYPVSKLHPEAGAWAPCSFYFYKIKGENKVHMGWLSVENWITSLDIQDKESIEPLREAQGMIEDILNDMLK